MPFTASLISFNASRRYNSWRYKLVPTNSSYSTGGDTLDLTAVTIPAGFGRAVPDFFPTKDQVNFLDTCAGNLPEWVKGTTLKNGKIKFFSSAGTELAASTYSAPMQADDFYIEISQKRGVSQ